jgi:hypothetical protein
LGEFKVAPQRVWQGSVLDAAAFACPAEAPLLFDAVLCVGVAPHLPEGGESTLLRNLHQALRPGGTVILEARNELFSLFTLNRYSHELFLKRLVPVAELRAHAAEEESAGLETAITELSSMFRTDLPPIRKGKQDEPGYDEVVSRLHNPLVLGRQFASSGFTDVRTLFYHFHSLPPMLSQHAPHAFLDASLQMENDPQDWRGYFMASAFLVVATRA